MSGKKLHVSLNENDAKLIAKLRRKIEPNSATPQSVAQIVREALIALAEKQNVRV